MTTLSDPPSALWPTSLRIVSLVPSVTELLVDLGLGPCLVGRTGFCIHPQPFITTVAKVGGTKSVNIEKIRRLRPSHVAVNIDENEKPTVDALAAFVPHVVVTHPQGPQDNLALIDQLMAAFSNAMPSIANYSIDTPANRLKQQLTIRLEALAAMRRGQPAVSQRVLYLIWREPWMTVARDTYISRMLALIGWQTLPNQEGGLQGAARYPVVAQDAPWLQAHSAVDVGVDLGAGIGAGTGLGIDRVLLSSEPYCFSARHVQEVQAWLPQARVQLVDGEMLSWYGSRAVRGLDYLAALAAD